MRECDWESKFQHLTVSDQTNLIMVAKVQVSLLPISVLTIQTALTD